MYGTTIDFWECMNDFISHFTGHVITYPSLIEVNTFWQNVPSYDTLTRHFTDIIMVAQTPLLIPASLYTRLVNKG